MEYLGFFAFIILLCYSGLPGKVKHLETKIKKLSKTVSINNKGENVMSKLLNDLVGKKCIIKTDVGLEMVATDKINCKVIEADEDWLKIEVEDKKGGMRTTLLRIEDIERVELLENNSAE